MKPRLVLLVLMLTAVTAATAWRLANPHQRRAVEAELLNSRSAPAIQLLDQNNRPVQLRGYLGRHRVLIAFFDGLRGPDGDATMQRLREVLPALKSEGVMVLGVSTPLAPDVKPQTLSYPFPVLRDTMAGTAESCCNRWGVCLSSPKSGRPAEIVPSLFLVERDGLVAWQGEHPRPVSDADAMISAILRGE